MKRPETSYSATKRPKLTPTYSDSEEQETDRVERHFVETWNKDFPWLLYEGDKMFCRLCTKHRMKNIFAATGSINYRRSALIDHSVSAEHSQAIKVDQVAVNATPIFSSAIDQADKAMLTLFEAAYFVAKEDLVFLKFEKLTDLLQRCKCPFLPRELYRNRDGCHELVSVIADHMDFELTKLMQDSPYLGIMIDESTDLSVRKNLLIYINLLLRDGVVSLFAHLEEMKQCDAASLTRAIVEYLEEKDIELSKIAGLGSDGASVMVGKQNGVGARLRKLNPYMLSMHCVAHKLALASEAAASSVSYCKQHRSILKGIYIYFHTSIRLQLIIQYSET